MEQRANPVWAEAIQLVPVVVLASSFLLSGQVDLERAAPLFAVGALLSVPISVLVMARGYVLNPILVGADLWLWAGALVFGLGFDAASAALAEARATGLFVCALSVGFAATGASPYGYIGTRHPDPAWLRRASVGLMVLTAAAAVWAWEFRANLRLGGGLPFIALNVARRVMIARGQRLDARGI